MNHDNDMHLRILFLNHTEIFPAPVRGADDAITFLFGMSHPFSYPAYPNWARGEIYQLQLFQKAFCWKVVKHHLQQNIYVGAAEEGCILDRKMSTKLLNCGGGACSPTLNYEASYSRFLVSKQGPSGRLHTKRPPNFLQQHQLQPLIAYFSILFLRPRAHNFFLSQHWFLQAAAQSYLNAGPEVLPPLIFLKPFPPLLPLYNWLSRSPWVFLPTNLKLRNAVILESLSCKPGLSRPVWTQLAPSLSSTSLVSAACFSLACPGK